MTMNDAFLLRWLERADDLPPDQACERERIFVEIKTLYEKSQKTKERYR